MLLEFETYVTSEASTIELWVPSLHLNVFISFSEKNSLLLTKERTLKTFLKDIQKFLCIYFIIMSCVIAHTSDIGEREFFFFFFFKK